VVEIKSFLGIKYDGDVFYREVVGGPSYRHKNEFWNEGMEYYETKWAAIEAAKEVAELFDCDDDEPIRLLDDNSENLQTAGN